MKTYKDEWEQSYTNADNFLFYPDYNIIWFVAKFVKRRIGINEYKQMRDYHTALDLGCGIGSNMIFLNDYGFDAYGIDLSEVAIEFAKKRLALECNGNDGGCLSDNIFQASADSLPFDDNRFDFIVSHGVLDSMPLAIAKGAFTEAHRVLRENGLFYTSLICSDGIRYPIEFSGEVVVDTPHEKGTVQLYYNWSLINEMVGDKFRIIEGKLTTEQWHSCTAVSKRYSVVLEKK